jgi:hypothetical protein
MVMLWIADDFAIRRRNCRRGFTFSVGSRSKIFSLDAISTASRYLQLIPIISAVPISGYPTHLLAPCAPARAPSARDSSVQPWYVPTADICSTTTLSVLGRICSRPFHIGQLVAAVLNGLRRDISPNDERELSVRRG